MWGAEMIGEFLGNELHHLALNKSKIQVLKCKNCHICNNI